MIYEVYSRIVTPSIAIPAANIQDLNLDKSPILTQSETAPIVQKFVLLTTKPNIKPKIEMYVSKVTDASICPHFLN